MNFFARPKKCSDVTRKLCWNWAFSYCTNQTFVLSIQKFFCPYLNKDLAWFNARRLSIELAAFFPRPRFTGGSSVSKLAEDRVQNKRFDRGRVDYTVGKKCKASWPREKEGLHPAVLAAPLSLVAAEELALLFLLLFFFFLILSLSLSLFPPSLRRPSASLSRQEIREYTRARMWLVFRDCTSRPSVGRSFCPSVRPPKQVSYTRAKLFVDPGRFA